MPGSTTKKPKHQPAPANSEVALYTSIRALVVSARSTIARGVDVVQVHTNFEIGQHIVKFEQAGAGRAEYGKQVLVRLAARLTVEFGSGFSLTSLKLMRQFYVLHAQRIGQAASGLFQILQTPIGQTLSDQLDAAANRPFNLSWSHYVFLLGIKKTDERSFYEIEAISQSWALRELRRQFQSGLYERLALSRDLDGIRQLAAQGQIVSQPQDLLKEPLVLEFLGSQSRPVFLNPTLRRRSSTRLSIFCSNWARVFCLKRGKNGLPLTITTFL